MTELFDRLRSYAAHLSGQVDVSDTNKAVDRALEAYPPARRIWNRIGQVAAAVALTVGGNAGLVMAADGSVPGDALYSVDRAAEHVSDWIGAAADHRPERLQEAAELVARGDEMAALAVTDEALAGLSDAPGLTGLGSNNKDTGALLELAKQVVAAAHSGDSEAVQEAAHRLREQAQAIADANRSDNQVPPAGSPSDTRPGKGGDNRGKPEDSPSGPNKDK